LVVQTVKDSSDRTLDVLDRGEQAAILLAEHQRASLLLIDDLLGRQIAQSRGLNVTGLLGVLDEAAKQDLIYFPDAISRLQQTTFRASTQLIQLLLEQHQSEKSDR
jgi:predicted nucleic acid-binding protein